MSLNEANCLLEFGF